MIDDELLSIIYKSNKVDMSKKLQEMPSAVLPIITQSDVENRFITRYFVRPVNEIDYIVEVDKKQYEYFKVNPRFLTTSVKWKIIGKKETVSLGNNISLYGVRDTNKQVVAGVGLTFGGLQNYITDYLQFWFSEE